MNTATVNLGSIPVELGNAFPQGQEKVNVYNYATLIGARGIEYYDGLIKQMADEVMQNTQSLNAVNDMKNWTPSDWIDSSTGLPTLAAFERTTDLQAMGLLPNTDNAATFIHLDYSRGGFHVGSASYPPTPYVYNATGQPIEPATAGLYSTHDVPPETQFFNPDTPAGYPTMVDATSVTPYLAGASAVMTYQNSSGVSTKLTFTLPATQYLYSLYYAYIDTDLGVNTQPEGPSRFAGIYMSADNQLFYQDTAGNIHPATAVQNYFAPDDATLANWQGQAHDLITKLTQISQKEQAQMQDLIASYNKFMNFTSNLQERKERDYMSVIDHF